MQLALLKYVKMNNVYFRNAREEGNLLNFANSNMFMFSGRFRHD